MERETWDAIQSVRILLRSADRTIRTLTRALADLEERLAQADAQNPGGSQRNGNDRDRITTARQ